MSTKAAFNTIAEEVEVDAQDKASSADFKGRHAGETGLSNNPMVTKASFVLVFEMLERLAYYGIAANAVVYVAHQLNMTNVHAATLVQIWFGVSYVTPLIGASVADAYWGRFWTITIFSLVYMLGLLGLTLSAALPSMTPEVGQSPSGGMLALFWMAMYLVALGAGSMESCVSSFGADQFNPNHPSERHLIPRFFNWLHFVMNVGSLVAGIVIVNIQTNVSWGVGIGIPLASFCIAFAAFLAGSRKYRRIPPGGSPFARIFRVLGGACVHRKAQVPQDDLALFEVEGWESVVPGQPKLDRTASFRWLEKAAVETKPGQTDKWLATLTEVEEVKCVARLLPIFATLIVYNAVTGQMDTLFILQGEAMDTSLGGLTLAAATVSVVESISSLFWVAAYDLVIAPFFASKGRPISSLQRIGAGYVTAILAMVAAAIVEICRLNVVHSHDLTNTKPAVVTVPISVWWQVPQYFLIGMSESLAMVGSQELFYSQAPIAMRSTCSALQLLPVALGCYLAAGLMGIVQGASGGTWIADNLNQAHMDYFFWLLAGLQAAALVLYVIIAKRFRYRTIEDTGADFEALALVPATRAGLQFSPSMTRNLSRSIGAGVTSAASITTAHSCGVSMRRRSRRSVELSCSQKAEHQVHCDLS